MGGDWKELGKREETDRSFYMGQRHELILGSRKRNASTTIQQKRPAAVGRVRGGLKQQMNDPLKDRNFKAKRAKGNKG